MILILTYRKDTCYSVCKVIEMDEFLDRVPQQKKRLKSEQGRNPYDGLRLWSALTHGAGAALAAVGVVFLLLRAAATRTVWHSAAFAVYGFTIIGLYTASTLYHSVYTSERGRVALRKYDHVSIYLLIAGTYTPICLVALRGVWGWSLFGVIWALALAGLVMSIKWIMAPRWLTAGIYLFMGWIALAAIYPLIRVFSGEGYFWLLGGGVAYTLGGVLYALKWPGRNNTHFGCHEIFHVFIMLGSFAHFMMMYRVIVFL